VIFFMRDVGIVGGKMEPMNEDRNQQETITLQPSVHETEIQDARGSDVKDTAT
jgi:hypothetical protein